jgi:hypothetical protein
MAYECPIEKQLAEWEAQWTPELNAWWIETFYPELKDAI